MKASREQSERVAGQRVQGRAERQRDQQHEHGRAGAQEERAPDQRERGAGEAGADRAAEHELRARHEEVGRLRLDPAGEMARGAAEQRPDEGRRRQA
jgi:hypothetical protein